MAGKNQQPAESISYEAAAPSGPRSLHYRSLEITLDDTNTHVRARSVGILWFSDRPVAEASFSRHTKTHKGHLFPLWNSNPQA